MEVGAVHFYELHEGDNDVFADILLARDTEMEPDEFFELVQQIRRRVQSNYEHDTLIEAIADELERDHDFVTVSDDRLTAAVNVSKFDDDNFLADLEAEAEGDEYDDDDGDGDEGDDGDRARGEVRSLYVEMERNPDLPTH
jgi:hypothetical protein